MANVAYDPNLSDENTTSSNILDPQYLQDSSTSVPSGGEQPTPYVSDGNPYGRFGGGSSTQQSSPQAPSQSGRKTQTGASSGQFTNLQNYTDKNVQSSQQMGQAVEGKLQSTADLVRRNTENVNKQFQQGVDAGSVQDWQNAGEEARQAFQAAAGQQAQSQNWIDPSAQMYAPQQTESGGYSPEDQALIDSNMARVIFGDNTTRDFETQLEATNAIEEWNRLNPGYYQYGDQQDLGISNERLAEILNAQYSGPSDLFQTKGYADLTENLRNAQALQDQALGNDFRGELLRQTFASPNQQYSLGSQMLDDLLLGQGSVGESLKETARGLGSSESGLLSDDFQQNLQAQRQLAAERSQAMDRLRQESRSALDETALRRQQEVEDRLGGVIENWEQYPQYFRDRLTQALQEYEESLSQDPGRDLNLQLSNLEAQMLGLQGGEGLYNLLKEEGGVDRLLQTADYDRNRLISRDEQSQLARLQQIAELASDYGSLDSGINFRNIYENRDLAGTQTALDALDMQNFARQLQASEKEFQDYAKSKDLTGVGHGKATSGGAAGKKKKKATAYRTENLGDLIEQGGGFRNIYSDEGINQENIDKILGLARGVNTGLFEDSTGYGLNSADLASLNIGGVDYSDVLNPLKYQASVPLAIGEIAGENIERLGEGIANIGGNTLVGAPTNVAGNIVGELGRGLSSIASGISGSLFGSSKGLSKKAEAKAEAAAIQDLINKTTNELKSQGFGNQFGIKQDINQDLELLQLLGMLDSTNR